jgi:anaerobic ribonucleoside-triphosphate reductase
MLLSKVGQIKKRDGRIVSFEEEKIVRAVFNACRAAGDDDFEKARRIAAQVVSILEITCRGLRVPDVEEVQDLVEKILIENNHSEIAKTYILYREQHARLRQMQTLLNNADQMVDSYLGESDWRTKENSNMSYSLQGLNNYISSDIIAHYWLSSIYPMEIREAHTNGDFHLHDLGILGAYCCGWDLRDLLLDGFKGASGKTESIQARHFRSALGQIVNFFYTLQGEAAGAQAFSNFDTLLAPFIRYDGLSYTETKQALQEFIFNLNVPTRVGFQTPFTNLSFDLTPPSYLRDEAVVIGNEAKDISYGDFQVEMDTLNRAFAEVMGEGDARGRIFTFPIPTYSITPDFQPDNPKLDTLWEMTAKYGVPYFANFLSTDMRPEDARSMCCRLRLDVREIKRRGGGLFGSNPLTGSIGVVTLNMPRIAYLSKSEDEFYTRLENLLLLARDSLEIKRKMLERLTDEGLFPYSQYYLRSINQRFKKYWSNHFSTIGLIGMNEACLNYFARDVGTQEGITFSLDVLGFIKEKLAQFQDETGNLYNLEATPGESAGYRLARLDRTRHPEIVAAGDAEPYYTNSTQLPADRNVDLFEALTMQDELQQQYTGGTVFHCFLGERVDDPAVARDLVMKVAGRFGVPYFTLTPTFSICPEHGYLRGEVDKCPVCGAATEIYSRIVGYFRPVSQWNKGKTEEFGKRRAFEPELKERDLVLKGDIRNKGNIADRLSGEDSSGHLHEPMQLSLPILS